MSVEQMVRDLLECALKERLVAKHYKNWADPDPQIRTSGELVGTANLLAKFLRENQAARDDRWQAAVGMALGETEASRVNTLVSTMRRLAKRMPDSPKESP